MCEVQDNFVQRKMAIRYLYFEIHCSNICHFRVKLFQKDEVCN